MSETTLGARLRLIVAAACAAVVGISLLPPVAAHAEEQTKETAFYIVVAHPDDEQAGWQLVDDFQEHYSIFVTTTQGEGTYTCLTAEQARTYHLDPRAAFPVQPYLPDGRPRVGPFMYEGPDSPVREPDLGERHPFGDPWVGSGSPECKRARVAAWHWFLDDISELDPGLPNFGISSSPTGDPRLDDDYQGRFCPVEDAHPSPNHSVHPGSDPKGQRQPQPLWNPSLGCVEVWADEMGARVAFDLGDGGTPYGPADDPYDKEEVIAAIETLRAQRGSWGIPVLPEAGIMAAAVGCDLPAEGPEAHTDHEAIQNALYEHDFGIGAQYGVVCDGDTNQVASGSSSADSDRRYIAHPGEEQVPDALEWWDLHSFDPVTYDRTGIAAVDYGFLAEPGIAGDPRISEGPGAWDFPVRTMWKRYDDPPKEDVFFVVAAHPDDEMNSWAMIEEKVDDDTYGVFTIMTHGEGTTSCLAPDDPKAKDGEHYTGPATFIEGIEANITAPSTGPYKYQGPDSPVDEDDMGERHPLGDPWQGQGSQACKDARVASWHWFLDDVNAKFGLGTSFNVEEDPRADDDYLGKLCGQGGAEGTCADVWANEDGARVAFDLGNTVAIPQPDETWTYGDPLFGVEDVIKGIQTLLENRERWGIPNLPSSGMVSASTYFKGVGCAEDTNPDHKLIQDALSGFDFDAGPQFGPLLCQVDPYGESGQTLSVLSPKTLVEIQLVDPVTENRAGSLLNENYGWLFPTYLYTKSAEQYFRVYD